VLAHPLTERLQQHRLWIGWLGDFDSRPIHTLCMSQKQPCASQDIHGPGARIPTAPASREVIAEALESRIVQLADGQAASSCPTRNVLRRSDVSTSGDLGIAVLKQVIG
jgi:hypothetical protein